MTLAEVAALLVGIGALGGIINYFFNRDISERLSETSILKSNKEIEVLEQEIESKYAQQVIQWLGELEGVNEKHSLDLAKKDKIILDFKTETEILIHEISLLKLKLGQCGRAHRRLFVELHIPYWECGKDGKLIYANGYWLQLFGLSNEEAMGEGWLASVAEEDKKQLLVDWYSRVVDESDGELQFRIVNPISKKETRVKAIYAVKFDDHSEVYKIIGVTLPVDENSS